MRLLIIMLLISSGLAAQTTYYIRADSTRLQKVGGNNELIIENATRTFTGGYLKNRSNGRTEFDYAVDSASISGSNLTLWRGNGTQNIVLGLSSTVPISSLTAAVATNSINNLNLTQIWDWTTLAATGLDIRATSTAASGGTGQRLFAATLTGANINSGQTTYSGRFINGHTGATSTNVAGYFYATDATLNNAIIVPASGGRIGFGTETPAKQFHNVGTVRLASLGSASADTTTYKPLGIDSNGDVFPMTSWKGGGTTWNAILDPTGDQALTFDAGESSTWTNSNTTEDLFTVNSSTTTTSSFFSLNRTGTALAAGNNIMELVSSGANGTNAITATGARISVTNTNATSGTNVGLDITASGATTDNIAVNATGNLYVTGNGRMYHLIGGTSAPTIAAGTGAGTGPTVTIGSGSTDLGGYITVLTGSAPAGSATVATITFNVAYAAAPHSIMLTPANEVTATIEGAQMVYIDQSSITTTTFKIDVSSFSLAGATTYKWFYQVIQ